MDNIVYVVHVYGGEYDSGWHLVDSIWISEEKANTRANMINGKYTIDLFADRVDAEVEELALNVAVDITNLYADTKELAKEKYNDEWEKRREEILREYETDNISDI